MRAGSLSGALTVFCLLFVLGCGSDDPGPNPVTGVDITPEKAALEIGHSTGITAKVTGGDNKSLTWFVNGIENGNPEYGTISQSSPVTYNAPDALPSPRTVVIGAVSVEDTSKVDTCRVAVEFTRLFVDSANGNDETATGCINMPFRTITEALKEATSGWTVLVRPGTYSDAAGESFPMYVPPGASLVGEDWLACIVRKATAEVDYAYAIAAGGNDCTIRKLTLRNDAPLGDARWDSSIFTGQVNTLIDSIRIFERAVMSCIRIDRATDAVVENCIIDVRGDATGSKIMDRAFEIVFGDQGTVIRNCLIAGHHTGLFFNGTSNALVEGCVLENCAYGAQACCNNTPDHTPIPDFGGGARGSAGGNTFRYYSECGIYNSAQGTIYAKFNTWHNDPPVAEEDYCVYGDGSTIVVE